MQPKSTRVSRANLLPKKSRSAGFLRPEQAIEKSKSVSRKPSISRRRVAALSPLADLEDRRRSLPIAQLREDEEKFFDLIEEGDVSSIKAFLKEHPKMNVNCANYMGLSAVHIAIQNNHTDVVRMLMELPGLHLRDSALHAVNTGDTELINIVLNALNNSYLEKSGYPESVDYSPDITPLILAAQLGNYEVVRLLFQRGHEIPKPHIAHCLCVDCKRLLREEGPSVSRIRLNKYRAICNPSYICQVTNDPILYGFLLDSELKQCAILDKEFRAEYIELAQEVRDFTVSLLNQCRSTDEADVLLKLPWGHEGRFRSIYPRIQVAIDYKQKEFVAQSIVQQVLTTQWHGEFVSWPRYSLPMKILHVLLRFLLLPCFCFSLLVMPPSHRLIQKQRSPLNRFLLFLAAYLMFVYCVLLLNVWDTGKFNRGAPNTGMESFVAIFVIGFIWQSLSHLWCVGCRRFFQVPWNWYDIVMEFTFVLSFFLWIASDGAVLLDADKNKKALERKFWQSYDPTLMHEGSFSIATVLAFGKLAYFCLQSSRLGPLQVSMGKMGVQIGYFLILCFIINTSFAVPLTRMYAYYKGMIQIDSTGSSRTQLSSFTTFSNSFSTLFWGMFGMSPVEAADVIVENLTNDKKNPVTNTHDFTEGVGRTLFAVYELLMIIALVNTLIAVLSNTFQKVVDNADVEFKFARTQLWTHFFDENSLLPSPFNLFPSPTLFKACADCFRALVKHRNKIKCSLAKCCYLESDESSKIDAAAYENLMANLVQRYFRSKEKQEETEV